MGFKPGRCLISERLNDLRENQQWLSEKTGISKSQISDYANNRRYMSLGTAKTVAEALKCHIDDLYKFVRD
jgi:transcriptional regulator with XRE-family HTH domain